MGLLPCEKPFGWARHPSGMQSCELKSASGEGGPDSSMLEKETRKKMHKEDRKTHFEYGAENSLPPQAHSLLGLGSPQGRTDGDRQHRCIQHMQGWKVREATTTLCVLFIKVPSFDFECRVYSNVRSTIPVEPTVGLCI